MKNFSKSVCLLLPAGISIPCLYGRGTQTDYVRKSRLPNFMQRIWWAIPFVVLAVRAQTGETDKRPWKFWAPYGMMCKKVAETHGYVIDHGRIIEANNHNGYAATLENEKTFSAVARLLRRWMPYGMILWWDREAVEGKPLTKASSPETSTPSDVAAVMTLLRQMDARLKSIERQMAIRSDNLDMQILKARVAIKNLKK